jgi:hypothetical protein
MKNKFIRTASIITLLVAIVLVFNLTIIPDFLSRICFSTVDKEFQYVVIPKKGRDVQLMEDSFKRYKNRKGIRSDDYRLYRVTPKEWNRIGNWYSYFTADHWAYPYMKIDIIE